MRRAGGLACVGTVARTVRTVRVLWCIGLALLAASAAILPGCGDDDDAVGALRTGFETRNGSDWTTEREERSFLRRLDAASDRVSVSVVGRSTERRPIRLIAVGRARTRAQIAAGRSVLFVCTQHGTEPAGREACLQMARDAVDAIGSATLLVVPTANPDGLAVDRRENGQLKDINRDHMALLTPEARAIAAVIRDYRPDLVGDFHEYKEPGSTTVLFSNPATLHLDIDTEIRRLTSDLRERAVRALESARFATDLYPTLTKTADESVLRQQAALRGSPSLLVETPRLGTLRPRQRVAAHRAAMLAILKMLRDRARSLEQSTSAARREAIARGASGRRRYYYASPTTYSDSPPCAYRLTDAAHRDVEAELDLHGVTAMRAGGAWIVPVAQPSQPVVGLLLDPRAPRRLTDGEPVAC